jgi:hypothetical protein
MNTGILRHLRPGQDRRDAGGLPGGGAVGNLCQRGHPSGRRPRHGFALTRKFSSHLQAPWRDFLASKSSAVDRRGGGPARILEGRRTGATWARRVGTMVPSERPSGTRSWGSAVGVRFSPYPLSPLPPDCAPIGSGQLGQHGVLPLPLPSLLSCRLEAAEGSTGAAPTPSTPPDLRPTLPSLVAGKAQQKGRAGKARP